MRRDAALVIGMDSISGPLLPEFWMPEVPALLPALF